MDNSVDNKDFNQQLTDMLNDVIAKVYAVRSYAKQHNLIHSQEYINFEDTLNAISTMDPQL